MRLWRVRVRRVAVRRVAVRATTWELSTVLSLRVCVAHN